MPPAPDPLPGLVPVPPGPGRRLVCLREDVKVEYTDPYRADDPLVAHTAWGPVDLGPQDGVGRAALWRMSLGPVDPANMRRDRRGQPRGLDALLDRLADVTVSSLAPADGTRPLLSVTPLARGVAFVPTAPDPGDPLVLAPSAVLRRGRAGLAVGGRQGSYRVDLHRPFAMCLTALFATPQSVDDLSALVDDRSGLVAQIVADLLGAGVLAARHDGNGPGHHHGTRTPTGLNGSTNAKVLRTKPPVR